VVFVGVFWCLSVYFVVVLKRLLVYFVVVLVCLLVYFVVVLVCLYNAIEMCRMSVHDEVLRELTARTARIAACRCEGFGTRELWDK